MDFRPDLDSELYRLGKEFLDGVGADSDDKQFALVQRSIELMPEGELKELGLSILGLQEAWRAYESEKRIQTEAILKRINECPDDDLDGVCADIAFNEAAVLNRQQHALTVEAQRVGSMLKMAHLQQSHDEALDAKSEEFFTERNRLADFASLIVTKAAQSASEAVCTGAGGPIIAQGQSSLLSVAVEAFCDGQLAEGNWTAKTEQENRAILGLWLRVVGDVQIGSYGYEQHRGYKSKLLKLPANLNKNPRYRGKSLTEVLALGDAPAAPNTINKNLSRVAAFFTWAVGHGYTNLNPAGGMTLRNPKRANEERKGFTADDLEKLFGTDEYTKGKHGKPYMHWAPLIALYTGARLNEIAQLHVADFVEDSGIPVLSINDEGEGKRLKTKAGKRLIPIHTELIRLGLLNYVQGLRKKRVSRLFPELILRRDGYGQTVSKWFARYCDRCGITEPGKVFHSFRHTVIDQLKQAGVAKEKIAALVGHEDESTTFGRYGKDFRPDVMAQVISQLSNTATQNL
jgi:integrase